METARRAVDISGRELEVARTKPQREEAGRRLNDNAATLDEAIDRLRKPVAELIDAVDQASHPKVCHEALPRSSRKSSIVRGKP